MKRAIRVVACLFPLYSSPLAAQSLSQRIAQAPADQDVTVTFPSDPELCGYRDAIIRFHDNSRRGYSVSYYSGGSHEEFEKLDREEMRRRCQFGPARLTLERSSRTISRIRVRIASPAPAGAVDLGHVTAQQAYSALADIARAGAKRARNDALAAMLVGDEEYWPTMLALAKDRDLDAGTRKNAVFWLGQAAGEKATRGLQSILGDNSEELEIRKQAVFALSQQRNTEAVDVLIDVAQTAREPELRKSALFWLGQRDEDPRVIALFEKILLGKTD